MRARTLALITVIWITAGIGAAAAVAAAAVKVVTTLPTYASLAREIGGDRVTVDSIVEPNQDPHFVQPKPSFALKLRDADLFVATGLDLEMWVTPVIDKSGNPRVREGQPGYVAAAAGVPLLDVPQAGASRAEGDLHVFGNPHITTGPINALHVARNIARGLARVDPDGKAVYDKGLKEFEDQLCRALFGDGLVDLIGGRKLADALQKGKLDTLLDDPRLNDLAGAPPLRERLGGLMARAAPLRGKEILTYHRTWTYFAATFGVIVPENIEPKPGIPPSARRVSEVVELIEKRKIKAFLVSSYFEEDIPRKIEERTGAKAVFVTLDVGGSQGIDSYVKLVEYWVDSLLAAPGEHGKR